jgi:hypothetical protein
MRISIVQCTCSCKAFENIARVTVSCYYVLNQKTPSFSRISSENFSEKVYFLAFFAFPNLSHHHYRWLNLKFSHDIFIFHCCYLQELIIINSSKLLPKMTAEASNDTSNNTTALSSLSSSSSLSFWWMANVEIANSFNCCPTKMMGYVSWRQSKSISRTKGRDKEAKGAKRNSHSSAGFGLTHVCLELLWFDLIINLWSFSCIFSINN